MASADVKARAALVAPSVLVVLLLTVAPLGLMAWVSTLARNPDGGVVWTAHTLDAYRKFLWDEDLMGAPTLNADYLLIFTRTFAVAAATTLLSLALGLPTALWMAFQPPQRRALLVFLVTLPFWTNLLVRNYAWILILRQDGLLEQAAHALGWQGRLGILYTPAATAVGLTYSALPFMILPIYLSMEKLDRSLLEAAFDLGANRWRAFTRVTLPLCRPGIVAGCVLVFIPGLGAFISPELLGGGKSLMLGNLIQMQFGQGRDWPFGAALSFVLLSLVLLALLGQALRARRA